ncbi:MAG TPA: hypothetical protein VGM69_03735 [Chloroflexota bacterium]|jgi:hypothetical protein
MGEYEIVYHADVRCYWCGHESGQVTSKTPINQPGQPIAFQPRGGAPVVVRSLGEVRCPRCRGPVFADNPDKRRVYPEFVFRQRRPRRPKVA